MQNSVKVAILVKRLPPYATPFTVFFAAALCLGGKAIALEGEYAGVSKSQPVMLTAQAIGYDEKTATAIAVGHVEVVQDDTILLADRVTYDQNTGVVHATGNVSVLEPSGDVLFAKDAVLRQSLEKGVVTEFRARLSDNSVFAACEAKKLSKNVTQLTHAVYSPCNVCAAQAGAKEEAPLWQMKAEKVTIDEDAQKVRYQNAFMDVYGMPVLYTPYFSHPTPDAPSQSGLLMPQYYHSTALGNVVKQPVYVSIAPNMDMTVTPWYISGENSPLIQGEFRHLTENAFYEIHGAFIDAFNRDAAGNITTGTEKRGYVDAHGGMKLSEHWNAGVDLEHASDDTFLALYGIGWQDMLTSRLYAERIEDRDYAVVQALAFQGLQPQDIASQSPYILPQANLHLESAPMVAHSRLALDSSALVLERQEGDNDQRISSTVSWRLPYITRDGQVIEAKASLRGDAYHVTNQTVNATTGEIFNGDTGRIIPEIDLDWRYPFVNRFGKGQSVTLAPVVELAASPNLHMSSNIPNEDSQVAELSNVNLFSPDRFAGLDQVESGLRGTYGMRGQLQFADEKYLEWLLGEAYQQNQKSPFPIEDSAESHFSDYIGRLAMRYKWFDASYAMRLDRNTLTPISNEVRSTFSLKPLTLSANYIDLRNEPLFGDRKEIFGDAGIDLTRHWVWSIYGRKDLGSSTTTSNSTAVSTLAALNLLTPTNGTVGLGTGLTFHNECMVVTSSLARTYITQQDVRPSTTVSVMVILKNFGAADAGSAPSAGNIAPGTEKIATQNGTSNVDIATAPDTDINNTINNAPYTGGQKLFDEPAASTGGLQQF